MNQIELALDKNYTRRNKTLLQKLNLTAFSITFLQFLFYYFGSKFEVSNTVVWVNMIVLSCEAIGTYSAFKGNGTVKEAVLGSAITGLIITNVLLFSLTNAFLIVPFIHGLQLSILPITLGKKALKIFIAAIIASNGSILLARQLQFIPTAPITIEPTLLFLYVMTAALISLILMFIIIGSIYDALQQLALNEQSLKLSNKNLQEAESALIIERNSLEEKVFERTIDIKQASQRKDAFLATMSHELRTPLNTILSRTQALQLGVYDPLTKKQSKTISGITHSGKHLLSLINDVLDVSKIEAGEIRIGFEQINITDAINDCLNTIRPMTEQNNLMLKRNLTHQVTFIEADPLRFRQIIINLLSNAIKFTPENKSIGLSSSEDKEAQTVSLTIWDEGIGISAKNVSTLFKPFQQIDSTLSRQYEGSGLGLVLVKQLTELHQGGVTLESEENVGSSFIVTFPWSQSQDVDADSIKSNLVEVH